MKNLKAKKSDDEAIDYEAIIDGFDPTKWRELTPEELAEHCERAKDAVIVEIEEIEEIEEVEPTQ